MTLRTDDLPALGQTLEISRRSTPSVPPGLFPPGGFGPPRPIEQPAVQAPIQPSLHISAERLDFQRLEPKDIQEDWEQSATPDCVAESTLQVPSKEPATPSAKKGEDESAKQMVTSQQTQIEVLVQPEASKQIPGQDSTEVVNITSPSKDDPAAGKRPHPGKLKIETTPAIEKKLDSPSILMSASAAKADVLTRPSRAGSITTPSISSRPGTPAAMTVSTGSPMRRTTQPRTLRITDTPRAETPPALPITAATVPLIAAATAGASKQASRRPSITSTNQPGTPISERVDTFSITSASASRASSPPPITTNKKGKKEKTSKQKKKDKEAKDAEIAAIITSKEPAEEVAPILARKTKSKKNKPVGTGPTPTRKAETTTVITEKKVAEKEATILTETEMEKTKLEEVKKQKEAKAAGKGKAKAPSPSPSPMPKTPTKEQTRPKESTPNSKASPNQFTAAAILQALDSTHQLALSTLSLLKPLSQKSELRKLGIDPFTSADLQNHIEQLRYELSRADEQLLIQGKAVRKDLGNDGRISGRTMISPLGVRVTCLTEEEEDKFLDLESRIWETKGQRRWGGGKPTTAEGSQSVSGLVQRAKPESGEDFGPKSVDGGMAEDLPYMPGQNRRAPFNDWKSPAASFNNSFVPPLAYDSTKVNSAPLPVPPPPELVGLMEVQTTSTGSVVPRTMPQRDGATWKEQLKGAIPPKDREREPGQTWREPMGVGEAVKVAREFGRDAARTLGVSHTGQLAGVYNDTGSGLELSLPSASKGEAHAFSPQVMDIVAEAMANAKISIPGKDAQTMLREWEKEVSAGHQHMRVRMNAVGIDGKGAERKLAESRRETEASEKRLNTLIKRNRKAALGAQGSLGGH